MKNPCNTCRSRSSFEVLSVVTTTLRSTRSSREGNTNVSSLIKQYFLAISDAVSSLSLVWKEEKLTKCSLDYMVWNNALTNIGCEQAIFILIIVQLRSRVELYHAMLKQKILPVSTLIQWEARRAKSKVFVLSPGTQNGRRMIKVYGLLIWFYVTEISCKREASISRS